MAWRRGGLEWSHGSSQLPQLASHTRPKVDAIPKPTAQRTVVLDATRLIGIWSKASVVIRPLLILPPSSYGVKR